jgi:hypothetical protein
MVLQGFFRVLLNAEGWLLFTRKGLNRDFSTAQKEVKTFIIQYDRLWRRHWHTHTAEARMKVRGFKVHDILYTSFFKKAEICVDDSSSFSVFIGM